MDYKDEDSNKAANVIEDEIDPNKRSNTYLFDAFGTQLEVLKNSEEILIKAIERFNKILLENFSKEFPDKNLIGQKFLVRFNEYMEYSWFSIKLSFEYFLLMLNNFIATKNGFDFLLNTTFFDLVNISFENPNNFHYFMQLIILLTEMNENYPESIEIVKKINFFATYPHIIQSQYIQSNSNKKTRLGINHSEFETINEEQVSLESIFTDFIRSTITENSENEYIIAIIHFINKLASTNNIINPISFHKIIDTILNLNLPEEILKHIQNSVIFEILLQTMPDSLSIAYKLPKFFDIDFVNFLNKSIELWNAKQSPDLVLKFITNLLRYREILNVADLIIPILIELPNYYETLDFMSKTIIEKFVIACFKVLSNSQFQNFIFDEFVQMIIDFHTISGPKSELFELDFRLLNSIALNYISLFDNVYEDLKDEDPDENEDPKFRYQLMNFLDQHFNQ